MKTIIYKFFVFTLTISLLSISIFAQRRSRSKPQPKPKTIVFAVLDDGKMIEPIGVIDKGELTALQTTDEKGKVLIDIHKTYYKPKTRYNLVFGSANKGTVTVAKSDPKAECASNLATVNTVSSTARINGFVMGLATNKTVAKTSSGVRRLPTAAERREIEDLVRDEFIRQGVAGNTVEKLKYHNLTAIDVDADGTAEMVGSFWTGDTAVERNLLFFIAEKQKNGKYAFGHSEFRKIIPDEVMSGEVKDLDDGVYHELLLDSLEYDGDNSAEIFTLVRGFEGTNFNVYSKRKGKWTKVFEGSNYHCAY
jgi:hypothetical protein